MTLFRSRFSDLFGLAAELGPYDHWPVLPEGGDPQLHASFNDRPQPFHLVHEHDAVFVHIAGRGVIEFPQGPVRYQDLAPGDHVYLPAGLPYRPVPSEPSLQLLIKAELAGLEGLVWYCPDCREEVTRAEFDTAEETPQRAYHRICTAVSESESDRTCGACGAVHPPIDLTGYRWLDVAELLENPQPQPEPDAAWTA